MGESNKRKCMNCGGHAPHFIPPSMGEPGFFGCEKDKPLDEHFAPLCMCGWREDCPIHEKDAAHD